VSDPRVTVSPQADGTRRIRERPRVVREKPNGDDAKPPVHWRGLDSYVVPVCWYEHESLVVALQALKDHERVAYEKSSPGSSGTDWHRAFRDITSMLRQFTADLRCGHGLDCAEAKRFDRFKEDDISRRRRRAATVALGQSDDSALPI